MAVNHSAVNEALCLVVGIKHQLCSMAGHSMGHSAQCLITHVVSGKCSEQEMTAERRSLQTQRRKKALNKNRAKL